MSKENLKNKEHTSYFAHYTSKRGITLIALIITIIVMLILTGVTLSITLGDNGLVNKAKEATTQTQVAMDRELLLSAVVGAIGEDGKVNLSAIVLPEGFTGSNGTYTSKNGNAFTVSENGEIVSVSEGATDDTTEKGILDGKYYIPGISGEERYIEINNNLGSMYVYGNVVANFEIISINQETETYEAVYLENDEMSESLASEYRIIYNNEKIQNVAIYIGEMVIFQDINGIDHELDGIYISNDSNKAYKFNPEDGTYKNGYIDDTGIFVEEKEVEEYYTIKNSNYWTTWKGFHTYSSDLNTIVYDGETYTKQSN